MLTSMQELGLIAAFALGTGIVYAIVLPIIKKKAISVLIGVAAGALAYYLLRRYFLGSSVGEVMTSWRWTGLAAGLLLAGLIGTIWQKPRLMFVLLVLPLIGWFWPRSWHGFSGKLGIPGHWLIGIGILALAITVVVLVRRKAYRVAFGGLSIIWLAVYGVIAVSGIMWLIKDHLPQAIIATVLAFFGAVWFLYVSNRRFYHQPTNTKIAHWPSTLACGAITLGFLILPALHWAGLLLLLVSTTAAIVLTDKVEKTLSLHTHSSEEGEQDWLSGSDLNLSLLVKISIGAVVGLALALSVVGIRLNWGTHIITSLVLALLVPFLTVGSYRILARLQIIDIREVWLGVRNKKPIDDPRYVIYRQSGRDAFVTAGLALTRINPLLFWHSYFVLSLDKKEQVYITTPVQTKAKQGQSRGAGVIYEISVSVETNKNPLNFLKLGDDERQIFVLDQVITEKEGNKGTLGIVLRRIKEVIRDWVVDMPMDDALRCKGTLSKLNAKDWDSLVQKIYDRTGWWLEEVNILDATPEDLILAAIQGITVAEYKQQQAAVEAATAVIVAEGVGKAVAKEAAVAAEGIGITKEQYVQYKIRQTEAEQAALNPIIAKIVGRS